MPSNPLCVICGTHRLEDAHVLAYQVETRLAGHLVCARCDDHDAGVGDVGIVAPRRCSPVMQAACRARCRAPRPRRGRGRHRSAPFRRTARFASARTRMQITTNPHPTMPTLRKFAGRVPASVPFAMSRSPSSNVVSLLCHKTADGRGQRGGNPSRVLREPIPHGCKSKPAVPPR